MTMQVSRAIEAMRIIVEAEPGAVMDAKHDIIYVGGNSDDYSNYTDDQIKRLADLGFHRDEEAGCGFYAYA